MHLRVVLVLQETAHHELAGYVKGSGGLKVMMMRNAGHSAPMDQPQWALRMVQAFIDGTL
jgi:carboxypeptidase C (cathepsin A)